MNPHPESDDCICGECERRRQERADALLDAPLGTVDAFLNANGLNPVLVGNHGKRFIAWLIAKRRGLH
jgi:hypothetical protein